MSDVPSSADRARGAGADGFTLMEVILAMTALALIAATCYGAFYLGIRATERGEVAVVTTGSPGATEITWRETGGGVGAASGLSADQPKPKVKTSASALVAIDSGFHNPGLASTPVATSTPCRKAGSASALAKS